jgi:O-antigen ligase
VPAGTWNAFYAMFVPLATLLLAVQIGADQRQLLLRLFLIIGFASGLLGILQVVGPTDGPLYAYNVTNNGSAVGLFSNRNHQAMFLATMFPMLAIFASNGVRTVEQSRLRMGLSVIAGVVLIPLLLVTGSRGGLIAGLIGLLSLPALYVAPHFERPAKRRAISKPIVYASGVFAIIGLSLLTILFARAQAFDRLLSTGTGDEERLIAWAPVLHMAWKYAPVGSGFGSFVEVYQIDETISSLSTSYFNHAHNDLLEIALEGGALALLLLLLAYFGWAKAAWSAWRSPSKQKSGVSFARLGSIILLILALGSLGDYPLRVPSLACFAMIAACWLSDGKGQPQQK